MRRGKHIMVHDAIASHSFYRVVQNLIRPGRARIPVLEIKTILSQGEAANRKRKILFVATATMAMPVRQAIQHVTSISFFRTIRSATRTALARLPQVSPGTT